MLPTKIATRAVSIGHVDPERFPGLSAFTRAFLGRSGPKFPAAIAFPRDPRDRTVIAAYRDRATPDRARLAAVVRSGLVDAGATIGPEREQSLEALARPGSVVVVTGQQVGLATGPLYTLYKALTAVAIARALRAAGERDVVPLFWCASDDHDLAEVDSLRAPDPDGGEVRKFKAGIGAISKTPAFSVRASASVTDALDRFVAAHPKTEFSESVLQALGPRSDESLATWFLRAIADLPGLEELLPVEGRAVMPFASRVIEAELRDPAASGRALEAGKSAIRSLGFEPVLADLKPPFLYDLSEGRDAWQRLPLGTDGRLRGVPSPNVALRPVVQGEALPAAVVVGGPGELAYWAEAAPLFDRHGVPRPAIMPRFSATLLDSRSEKALRALGLEPSALFELPQRAPAPAAVPRSLESHAAAADAALAALEREAAAVEPTLEKPAKKIRETTAHSVAKLMEKISEAAGAAGETSLRRYRKLLGSVLPDGVPQERVLGPWTFFNQFGLDLARAIGDIVDPTETRHAVLRIETANGEGA